MSDADRQMKACPHCGQAVKMSSYRCHHCGRSLAESDQQEWEQLIAPIESSRDKSSREVSEFDRRRSNFAVAASCLALLAIVIFFVYQFLARRADMRRDAELVSSLAGPGNRPKSHGAAPPKPGKTSFIRIHETPFSSSETTALLQGKEASAVSEDDSSQERERLESIQLHSTRILEELIKEEAVTPYTIHLKSGRKIDCDVTGESETQLVISRRGLTTTLERDSIESIEHRSPESVQQEMEKLALARATEIVNQGLVRHGKNWIAPEEKARRTDSRLKRDKAEQVQNLADTKKQAPEKSALESFNERSDREKLDSLLSLLRKTKVIDADFFGGTLHMEDRSDSDNASCIAFEATGRQLDISQICSFLGLPVAASGVCDADVAAFLDKRKPTTLSGNVEFTAENATIPPIPFAMLISPLNEQVGIKTTMSADDGVLNIEALSLEGTAYSVGGGGVIHLSDQLEQSLIACSFSVLARESPTVSDTRLAGKSAQYILDALTTTNREILVEVSGSIAAPELKIKSKSARGSLVWKFEK